MKIQIDSSQVHGNIEGCARLEKNFWDRWRYKDVQLESGKIYALISEHGQGCMYLSYLVGGRVKFDGLCISIDDSIVSQKDLENISWNLEPSKERYRNKKVKKSIRYALKKFDGKDLYDDIVKIFYLDESRYNVKMKWLSGERWRASAALGYASGKKIYYAPYKCSGFYHLMYVGNMFKVLRYLADNGAIIVLPVGSDTFIKSVVDECIYLDPNYEV